MVGDESRCWMNLFCTPCDYSQPQPEDIVKREVVDGSVKEYLGSPTRFIFIEHVWTPGEHIQAVSRVLRPETSPEFRAVHERELEILEGKTRIVVHSKRSGKSAEHVDFNPTTFTIKASG